MLLVSCTPLALLGAFLSESNLSFSPQMVFLSAVVDCLMVFGIFQLQACSNVQQLPLSSMVVYHGYPDSSDWCMVES